MSKRQLTTKEFLLSKGIRSSAPRVLIYDYLCRNGVDADPKIIRKDLLTSLPTLSLTSVYNALNCFSSNGLFKNMRTSAEIKVCTIELHKILGYALLIGEEAINLGNLQAAEYFENHYKQLGYKVTRKGW